MIPPPRPHGIRGDIMSDRSTGNRGSSPTSNMRNGARSPGPRDDELINVSSASPALFVEEDEELHENIDSRLRTTDMSDAYYGEEQQYSNGDEEEEEEEDDDADRYSDVSEHNYHQGLHQIPMHSPGEDSVADIVVEQRTGRAHGTRVFFQSEGGSVRRSGVGYRDAGGRILRRITLRRRKRGEDEGFWSAIFISNLLSLAVLACLVIYLTQTDFFASHQTDLFGTTVDNRFTVVSDQFARAKIYLKSGYSNSRFSEAMIAFGGGVMQLGRRALAVSDLQEFYGVSLLNNGTANFTNVLFAPAVETGILHVSKAVQFQDGTTLTTGSDLTKGLTQVGDLHLVSTKGSVRASAGGEGSGLVLYSNGSVIISMNQTPDSNHILLDGANGSICISDGEMVLTHSGVYSEIRSKSPLLLNTSSILIGGSGARQVSLSLPEAERLSSTDTSIPASIFEISGQNSSQKEGSVTGGDLILKGGTGFKSGGTVRIVGGTPMSPTGSIGTVLINVEQHTTNSSSTVIGTLRNSSNVSLYGMIKVNEGANDQDNVSLVVGSASSFIGPAFNAHSTVVELGNTSSSNVSIEGQSIHINTKSGGHLKMGSLKDPSNFALSGHHGLINVKETLAIGFGASQVTIGSVEVKDQYIDVSSDYIRLNASSEVIVNPDRDDGVTTVFGKVTIGGLASSSDTKASSTSPPIEFSHSKTRIESKTISLGSSSTSTSLSLQAQEVSIGDGKANSSSVVVDGDTLEVKSHKVSIGTTDGEVKIVSKKIELGGEEAVRIGLGSLGIQIGSKATKKVTLTGEQVSISSDTPSFQVESSSITIGNTASTDVVLGNGASRTQLLAQNIEISGSKVVMGTSTSDIELKGRVTVNGVPLSSSRLLKGAREEPVTQHTSVVGLLQAEKVQLQVSSGEFFLPFDDILCSSPEKCSFKKSTNEFRVGDDLEEAASGGYFRLSLSLSGVRLHLDAKASSSQAQPRLRCRVYRVPDDKDTRQSQSVLQAVADLDTCYTRAECEDDDEGSYFLGVEASQVVRYHSGDRFTMKCSVSQLLATDNMAQAALLVQSAQIAFVTF